MINLIYKNPNPYFFGNLDSASPRRRTPPPPVHFGTYAAADPKINGGHAWLAITSKFKQYMQTEAIYVNK